MTRTERSTMFVGIPPGVHPALRSLAERVGEAYELLRWPGSSRALAVGVREGRLPLAPVHLPVADPAREQLLAGAAGSRSGSTLAPSPSAAISFPISAPSVEYENAGVRSAREPTLIAVPHIARTHADQRHRQQVVDRHLGPLCERAVRTYAHRRSSARQLGGLETGGHVVTVETVHQPQAETALGEAPVDLRPLRAHHLDLGDRLGGPEIRSTGRSSGTVTALTVPTRTTRLMRCCSPAATTPSSRSTRAATGAVPRLPGAECRAFQLFGPHPGRMRRHSARVQGFPCHTFVKFNGPRYENGRVFLDGSRRRLPPSTA